MLAKNATKKPSSDPKVQAERERNKKRMREQRKMRSLGYDNVAGSGKPAIWVLPGDVPAPTRPSSRRVRPKRGRA